jgi:hypothetical protein
LQALEFESTVQSGTQWRTIAAHEICVATSHELACVATAVVFRVDALCSTDATATSSPPTKTGSPSISVPHATLANKPAADIIIIEFNTVFFTSLLLRY